jgi:hypothetical protein
MSNFYEYYFNKCTGDLYRITTGSAPDAVPEYLSNSLWYEAVSRVGEVVNDRWVIKLSALAAKKIFPSAPIELAVRYFEAINATYAPLYRINEVGRVDYFTSSGSWEISCTFFNYTKLCSGEGIRGKVPTREITAERAEELKKRILSESITYKLACEKLQQSETPAPTPETESRVTEPRPAEAVFTLAIELPEHVGTFTPIMVDYDTTTVAPSGNRILKLTLRPKK